MRLTLRLLHPNAKLTLFTRANCSLCDTAKSVVSNVRKHQDVQYSEIDVMRDSDKRWKDLYEFDTPVVTCVEFLSFLIGTYK